MGRGDRRQGQDEGDRRLERRPPLRPPGRPARVLRQPAPALHGLEAAQRRAPRGGRPPEALDLRVRRPGRRDRQGASPTAPRKASTSASATPGSRRSFGRTWASSRPRARGSCPSSSRSRTSAATCTRTRRGRRTGRTRSRRWRTRRARLGRTYLVVTDHSHYLREGRMEAQSREIDKVQEGLGRFRLLKGVEANIRADGVGRRRRRGARHARLGDGLGALRLRQGPRPSACSRRWRTRTWTASATSPGRKLNRRGPADVDLERIVEKALETGTFLEINAQPDRLDLRDAHARLAGEAGVKIVISSDGASAAARSRTSSSASPRRGARGSGPIRS